MFRIPPSERVKQAINNLLQTGIYTNEGITSLLVRLGAQRLIQELLEQEVTDFLGRERYERKPEDQPNGGLRNGYKTRHIDCAEGRIPVELPQVRNTEEPYRSRLMEFLLGNSDVLEKLVVEMYARGLSTRDIEDTFRGVTGECLISRSGVSEVTEVLWEEYKAFSERDLSGFDVVYLFLDAIYESLREQAGVKEGILCAWAILANGSKVLLHLALGNKESYNAWLEFLRDMVSRGLKVPLTVTTDGAPGLIRAVEEVWPQSLRIRCWVHKMRNVLDKVPEPVKADLKAHLVSIRDAASYDDGRKALETVLNRFEGKYPSAMKSLKDDLEASLNHLRVPPVHRKYVRTTNLIERSFLEQRRRTKVIPRFFDEKSCLKLVFATLWRASQKWRRVRFTEHEQEQLKKLRDDLGFNVLKSDKDEDKKVNSSVA